MENPVSSFKSVGKGGKIAIVVGGAAVAYYMYKRKAASSSSSSSTGIDPVTGLPYSQDNMIDPMTGMTYLAEATQYGSVSAAEAALAGSGVGTGAYGTGGYPVTTGSGGGGTTSGYGTNAQWAQAVESGLSSIGYNPTNVADAIGRYLGGLPLTSSEATIVYAALGEYGNPPVGSYKVILQPSRKPKGGSSGGHHPKPVDTVDVPNLMGDRMIHAEAKLQAAGLHASVSGDSHPKRAHYVKSQSPAAGHKVPVGSTVRIVVSIK